MRTRVFLSFHGFLSFALCIFSVLIINLASQVAYTDWQRKSEADNFLKVNEICSLLFKSTSDWAVERGITDIALVSPKAASPETFDKLSRVRENSDMTLRVALERLSKVAQSTKSAQEIAETKDIFQAVVRNRQRADSEMAKEKSARDPDLGNEFFPTLRGLIDKVNILQLMLETLIPPPSAQNAQLVTLRYLAAQMVEYAGRERTRMAAIIEDGRPLDSEDIKALSSDRGHIEQAWVAINMFRDRPDASPQVVTAIKSTESDYFHTYDNLRNQIYAAGVSGNYPISSDAYFNQASTAMDSILSLATTMDNASGIEAASTASACNKQLGFSTLILLLSSVIAGISFWVFLKNTY